METQNQTQTQAQVPIEIDMKYWKMCNTIFEMVHWKLDRLDHYRWSNRSLPKLKQVIANEILPKVDEAIDAINRTSRDVFTKFKGRARCIKHVLEQAINANDVKIAMKYLRIADDLAGNFPFDSAEAKFKEACGE